MVLRGIPDDFTIDDIQFDFCSGDRSPLWLVLAVLPKTEEAKLIFKNSNQVCGLSGIRVQTPRKKGSPDIRIEKEIRHKDSLEPKNDLPPVSEVQKLIKSLKTRKASGLNGISNKAIKIFFFPFLGLLVAIFKVCLKNCYLPPICKEAQQALRPVEYITEGFKTKRKTVTVFFDVAKTFDRASSSLTLFVDNIALYFRTRYKKSTHFHLQRAIHEFDQWFRTSRIETSPVSGRINKPGSCRCPITSYAETIPSTQEGIIHRDSHAPLAPLVSSGRFR
ncbi:hypothetical protein EVAR_81108_1 [Eumeta japonica]|uniref:Uncharacterized protein n=1 Tax=Eumeta variegata TaxID=151549 RepID=A0A4C1T6N0_EUMVA|nr:hypothetical protein EVAR_81108_1 [Eumeta japonica]